MQEKFRKFSVLISNIIGSIWSVTVFILLLAGTGFYFNFSNDWERHISLLVASVALLILFFLQKSQNHNEKVFHLKLDELIRAVEGARIEVTSTEHHPEYVIDSLRNEIEKAQSENENP